MLWEHCCQKSFAEKNLIMFLWKFSNRMQKTVTTASHILQKNIKE
jgi:hypothetical protein